MSYKDGRHSASGKRRTSSAASNKGADSRLANRSRREPLRDNYYYEEPRAEDSRQFEDMSSYSSSRKKKDDLKELERQRKQGGGKAKKIVLVSVLVFLLLIGAALYYVFGYVLKDLTIDQEFTKNLHELGITTSAAEGDEPIILDDSITNIALFGVDARDSSFEGRSDVIMIVSIDNRHGKIKMSSILRDTCVQLEDGSYAKLTDLYSYGGPELSVKTLNQNFSAGNRPLYITDYATVNFAKMADIVDAFGGVDLELTGAEVQQINVNLWSLYVDVNNAIEDDKYNGTYESRDDYAYIDSHDMIPNIYGEKVVDSADYEYEDGTYHLNGNQAVAYGRIRHLDSDNVRAERQQNVLKALISKMKTISKLEYPETIRKILPLVKTSLDFNDIMSLAPIILTDFTIETMNIPGENETPRSGWINGGSQWVYVYDLDFAAKHLSTFIYESDSQFYGQELYPDYYFPDVPETDSSGSYYASDDELPAESQPVSSAPESSGLESEPPMSSWPEGEYPGDGTGSDSSSYPDDWMDIPSDEPSGGDADEYPNYPETGEDGGGSGDYTDGDTSGWEEIPGSDEVTPF